MKHTSLYSAAAAAVGMAVLILDGKTALAGAQAGIELCFRTVIPSLFPFFVLSSILTNSLLGTSTYWLRPLGTLCGIPKGAECILLTGFLGGYPVGARAVSEAYHTGILSRQDAHRMLMFCSNAGPAFLFGMVGSFFPERWMVWALWGIHILSAVLCASVLPRSNGTAVSAAKQQSPARNEIVSSSVRVMAAVCGWIILFRIVITFLQRWILWCLPDSLQVAWIGFLELSNGCCELGSVKDLPLRFILCSGMLSFGGLCVMMQTASVIGSLSVLPYALGKLLQSTFSVTISIGLLFHSWVPFFIVLSLSIFFFKKGVAFPALPMYNGANKSRRPHYVVSEKD